MAKNQIISTAAASPKIWRLLRTNTSAVYLHVLVIKTDPPTDHQLRLSSTEGIYICRDL